MILSLDAMDHIHLVQEFETFGREPYVGGGRFLLPPQAVKSHSLGVTNLLDRPCGGEKQVAKKWVWYSTLPGGFSSLSARDFVLNCHICHAVAVSGDLPACHAVVFCMICSLRDA